MITSGARTKLFVLSFLFAGFVSARGVDVPKVGKSVQASSPSVKFTDGEDNASVSASAAFEKCETYLNNFTEVEWAKACLKVIPDSKIAVDLKVEAHCEFKGTSATFWNGHIITEYITACSYLP
ncbi:MAG: hypothetical protein R3A80_09880 [Bdellovibrionota bacterium]